MRLWFYGISDDLFECESDDGTIREEIGNCGNGRPLSYLVEEGGLSLVVTGIYDEHTNGCWLVGARKVDEDEALPAWTIEIGHGHEYSVALHIELPDGATVKELDEVSE